MLIRNKNFNFGTGHKPDAGNTYVVVSTVSSKQIATGKCDGNDSLLSLIGEFEQYCKDNCAFSCYMHLDGYGILADWFVEGSN